MTNEDHKEDGDSTGLDSAEQAGNRHESVSEGQIVNSPLSTEFFNKIRGIDLYLRIQRLPLVPGVRNPAWYFEKLFSKKFGDRSKFIINENDPAAVEERDRLINDAIAAAAHAIAMELKSPLNNVYFNSGEEKVELLDELYRALLYLASLFGLEDRHQDRFEAVLGDASAEIISNWRRTQTRPYVFMDVAPPAVTEQSNDGPGRPASPYDMNHPRTLVGVPLPAILPASEADKKSPEFRRSNTPLGMHSESGIAPRNPDASSINSNAPGPAEEIVSDSAEKPLHLGFPFYFRPTSGSIQENLDEYGTWIVPRGDWRKVTRDGDGNTTYFHVSGCKLIDFGTTGVRYEDPNIIFDLTEGEIFNGIIDFTLVRRGAMPSYRPADASDTAPAKASVLEPIVPGSADETDTGLELPVMPYEFHHGFPAGSSLARGLAWGDSTTTADGWEVYWRGSNLVWEKDGLILWRNKKGGAICVQRVGDDMIFSNSLPPTDEPVIGTFSEPVPSPVTHIHTLAPDYGDISQALVSRTLAPDPDSSVPPQGPRPPSTRRGPVPVAFPDPQEKPALSSDINLEIDPDEEADDAEVTTVLAPQVDVPLGQQAPPSPHVSRPEAPPLPSFSLEHEQPQGDRPSGTDIPSIADLSRKTMESQQSLPTASNEEPAQPAFDRQELGLGVTTPWSEEAAARKALDDALLPADPETPAPRRESKWKKFARKAAAPFALLAGLAGLGGYLYQTFHTNSADDSSAQSHKAGETPKTLTQKIIDDAQKAADTKKADDAKKEAAPKPLADPSADFNANTKAEDISSLAKKLYPLPHEFMKWAAQHPELNALVKGEMVANSPKGIGYQVFRTFFRVARNPEMSAKIMDLQGEFNRDSGLAAMYQYGGMTKDKQDKMMVRQGPRGVIASLTSNGTFYLTRTIRGLPVEVHNAGGIALSMNFDTSTGLSDVNDVKNGDKMDVSGAAVIYKLARIVCPEAFEPQSHQTGGLDRDLLQQNMRTPSVEPLRFGTQGNDRSMPNLEFTGTGSQIRTNTFDTRDRVGMILDSSSADAEITSSVLSDMEAAAVRRVADIEEVEIDTSELTGAEAEAVEREVALNEIDNSWDDIKAAAEGPEIGWSEISGLRADVLRKKAADAEKAQLEAVEREAALNEIDNGWDEIATAPAAKADPTAAIDAEWGNIADAADQKIAADADRLTKRIALIKQDRTKALLERGEVFVPHLSEANDESVRAPFVNGFLKQCETAAQMDRVEKLVATLHTSDFKITANESGAYLRLNPEKFAEILMASKQDLPEIRAAVSASATAVANIVPSSAKKAA